LGSRFVLFTAITSVYRRFRQKCCGLVKEELQSLTVGRRRYRRRVHAKRLAWHFPKID
jgi:hypothetical protein